MCTDYAPGQRTRQPPTPTPYGASTIIAKRSSKTCSVTAEKLTMSTATTAHDLKPSRMENEAVPGPCSSLHHCHREGQPAQASKSAVRASRGAERTGNARGVQGVVWHHGRRVSAVEGTKTNPLLMCTVTASDIGQHRESQRSCHRGEGNEGPVEHVGRVLGTSMSRMHAREGQSQKMTL